MSGATVFQGARVFDGTRFVPGPLAVAEGRVLDHVPVTASVVALDGGILMPGFVDLQVNGGGGVMFNDTPDLATLRIMADAHARLGALTILPTLITDTPEKTRAAIDAVAQAVAQGVPGIAGLHLEGPHLAPSRKGAHDGALIRPMQPQDLTLLQEAAARLPVLKVTLAPEAVSSDQIQALTASGVIVSLGHSDCTHAQAETALHAGARCATHLFNAMSQMSSRAPGLVGAVLSTPDMHAGVIADLVHVSPPMLKIALAARPEGLFLVSDAMAVAGCTDPGFSLMGRWVTRRSGRLELADGTLAGADLDLAQAVANLRALGVPETRALAMATRVPGALIGHDTSLRRGARADLIWLDAAGRLAGCWRRGAVVHR